MLKFACSFTIAIVLCSSLFVVSTPIPSYSDTEQSQNNKRDVSLDTGLSDLHSHPSANAIIADSELEYITQSSLIENFDDLESQEEITSFRTLINLTGKFGKETPVILPTDHVVSRKKSFELTTQFGSDFNEHLVNDIDDKVTYQNTYTSSDSLIDTVTDSTFKSWEDNSLPESLDEGVEIKSNNMEDEDQHLTNLDKQILSTEESGYQQNLKGPEYRIGDNDMLIDSNNDEKISEGDIIIDKGGKFLVSADSDLDKSEYLEFEDNSKTSSKGELQMEDMSYGIKP